MYTYSYIVMYRHNKHSSVSVLRGKNLTCHIVLAITSCEKLSVHWNAVHRHFICGVVVAVVKGVGVSSFFLFTGTGFILMEICIL